MRFSQCSLLLIAAAVLQSASAAFVHNAPSSIVSRRQQPQSAFALSPAAILTSLPSDYSVTTSSTSLRMESDFASAMPEAPKKSLREFLEEAADKTISTVAGSLGEGVEAVPELDALRKLRESDSAASDEDLSLGIYELMIERGMTYDEDADNGTLTPTDFDIKANLDVPEVKEEFSYLYKYGISLISKGLASTEGIKGIVEKRLIARTGKTPEEFDAWLGF